MTDPHERFHLWLTAGAEGDPPRDLAVHASVCPGCRQSIAALDLLANVDPKRAAMPPAAAATERRGLLRAGRLTPAAAGIVLGAVILGIGASQLIAIAWTGTARSTATISPTPAQTVLGSEATAQPSKPSPTLTAQTLTPLTSPSPTPQPTPRPTARPSPRPTAPASTPIPTPIPTATPIATTAPSVPDAPTGMTASTNNSAEIQLNWEAPADNGSAIINYEIYRDGSLFASTSATSYQDVIGGPATHTYHVIAVNAVGAGPASSPVTGTAV